MGGESATTEKKLRWERHVYRYPCHASSQAP